MYYIKRYKELNEGLRIPFTDFGYYFKDANDLTFKVIKKIKETFDRTRMNMGWDKITYNLKFNKGELKNRKDLDPYNEDDWEEDKIINLSILINKKLKVNGFLPNTISYELYINSYEIPASNFLKKELYNLLNDHEKRDQKIRKRFEKRNAKEIKKLEIKKKKEKIKELKNIFN